MKTYEDYLKEAAPSAASVALPWVGAGSNNKKKDYAVVKDENGEVKYLMNGIVGSTKPKDVAKPKNMDSIYNYFGIGG